MRVFLAGATGAIGRPLTARLLADGHEVTAMTRSPESALAFEADGAKSAVVDAFDASAVRGAIAAAEPEVVIHQLTALPSSGGGRAFLKGLALTDRLRRETVPVMIEAAAAAGARRAIVQSISFVTAPDGREIHDESAPLWTDAPDKPTAAAICAVADSRLRARPRLSEPSRHASSRSRSRNASCRTGSCTTRRLSQATTAAAHSRNWAGSPPTPGPTGFARRAA